MPKRGSLGNLLNSLKKPAAKTPQPSPASTAAPSPQAPPSSSPISELLRSPPTGLKLQPSQQEPSPSSVLGSFFDRVKTIENQNMDEHLRKAEETKKRVEENRKLSAHEALTASKKQVTASSDIESDRMNSKRPETRAARRDFFMKNQQQLEQQMAAVEPDAVEEQTEEEAEDVLGATGLGQMAMQQDRLVSYEDLEDESDMPDLDNSQVHRMEDAVSILSSGKQVVRGAQATWTDRCTVSEMAQQLGMDVDEALDIFRGLDSTIDSKHAEVSSEVAKLFNVEMDRRQLVIMIPAEREVGSVMTEEEKKAMYETFPTRPAVVCVMGHVDHGKTTLLDALRNSNMAKNEHGGITQAMGAFLVKAQDDLGRVHTLTFLDTPGHAAFKSMRQRGANLTDIIILVVGADDGVQPQTREVIRLAQETSTPVVVALNKMDSPNRDPERVRTQLLQCGLDITNDVAVAEISGLKRLGLEKLVQEVSFLAEVMDLRAPDQGQAEAVIVEIRMDRKSGPVLHTIVTWGRLQVGNHFVVGHEMGKVRKLVDHNGDEVDTIEPGFPAHVYGLAAIDESAISQDAELIVVESEEKARDIIEYRKEREALSSDSDHQRDVESRRFRMKMEKSKLPKKLFGRKRKSLSTLELKQLSVEANAEAQGADDDSMPNFSVVFKADNKGSLEAILDYFQLLPPSDEVSFNLVATGVGVPNPQDIEMARLSKAPMVLFNMKVPDDTMNLIRQAGIEVKEFKIIYQLFDFVRDSIAAKLPTVSQLVVSARIEYKLRIELNFKDKRQRNGLGCRVINGTLLKSHKLRIVRDDQVVAENVEIRSLRHLKDAVDDVVEGKDCCLTLDIDPSMVRPGDYLEALEMKKIPRTYDDSAARGYVDHRSSPFKHQNQ